MKSAWLERVRNSTLAKNTLWQGLGQTIRIGIQAAYFILIARGLGSREYGAYISVVALMAIAAPFATLGSGELLIKHAARSPHTFRAQWGKALTMAALSGLLLLACMVGVARLILPAAVPTVLIVLVGLADLVFVRMLDVSAQAYQGVQRLHRTAQVQLLLSPLRLAAAVALIMLVAEPTAMHWGGLYLISAVIGASVAVSMVSRELGRPELKPGHLRSELREGSLFAFSLSAQSIYSDSDKTILARLATLEAAGVYGAAARIVDVAFVPVGALVSASYARFFQHGADGIRAAAAFGRRLLGFGVAYALVAGAMLFLLSPALPVILGEEYRGAAEALRWLAPVPLLRCIHAFGSNTLTGGGHQGTRCALQVIIAVASVGLNLWLIPRYSWHGAAVANLLSHGTLAIAVWAAVWQLTSRNGHVGRREPSGPVLEPS